jgi:hypothetical protein
MWCGRPSRRTRYWRVAVAPALEWIVGRDTRLALLLLMGAVVLLLVVASVNVASLSVARALSRVQEFGVRRALGGSGSPASLPSSVWSSPSPGARQR